MWKGRARMGGIGFFRMRELKFCGVRNDVCGVVAFLGKASIDLNGVLEKPALHMHCYAMPTHLKLWLYKS